MTHSPKWRALIAYDSSALSADGRRHVEAHLAGCATCAEALAQLRAYDATVAEAQSMAEQASFEWSKMDLAMRREAKSAAGAARAEAAGNGEVDRRSKAPIVLGLLVAVAAALLLYFQQEPSPANVAETVAPEVTPQPEPEPEPATRDGVVVAVAGAVTTPDGQALAVGSAVQEGDRIEVEAGVTHVQLAEGTGFALASETTIHAARLRDDDVVVELDRGRITNQVRTGTPYYVDAPPYRIRVQGTRFEVRRDGERVAVTLDEGIVEILRGDELIRHMEAPDSWSSHVDFVAAELGSVIVPHMELDGVQLRLPDDPRIVEWSVGDVTLQGQAAAVSLQPGEIEIEGRDARGRRYETVFNLLAEGGTLAPGDLQIVRTAPAPGSLPAATIAEVVRPSHRSMRRCYERELRRNNPELRGAYTLRVSVARDGAVRSVRVITSDDLPPPLRNCLVRTASAWQFPSPGGVMTFDLPVNLSAGR